MGIFENLPYANFHELNLDWIIKTLKYLTDFLEKVDKEVNALDIDDAYSLLNQMRTELTQTTRNADNVVPLRVVHNAEYSEESPQLVQTIRTYTQLDSFTVPETGHYLVEAQLTYDIDGGERTDQCIMSTLMTFQTPDGAGAGRSARESTPLIGTDHTGSSIASVVFLEAGGRINLYAAQLPVSQSSVLNARCVHCETLAFRLVKHL